MNRTMKIDEDVARRLAGLKKKYKKASYSDLLEEICDFFEVTRLEPKDFDSSRKPPAVVITERTNRIIAFIKKSEDKYLKEILRLTEKMYVEQGKIVMQNNTPLESIPTPEIKKELPKRKSDSQTRIDQLDSENRKLREENERLTYLMNEQKKRIKEFVGGFDGNFGSKSMKDQKFNQYKELLLSDS